jgi:ABC-type microcin C transport system duplicated ATPase subunit YejF
MDKPLLVIDQLTICFNQHNTVVDGLSLSIAAGETFALVGESGSGKSITALSVLGLLPAGASIAHGAIHLNGINLSTSSEPELCKIRGRRIGFVFQDPFVSLNPVMTIGSQLAETLNLHFSLSPTELKQRLLELLQQVELPDPEQKLRAYPHQLSGGQRQRVMIALALAGQPDLLIADEPTTALDVTIQAQILALLKAIQQRTGMALWLISHDLALVSTIADRVAVMQTGKLVESGSTAEFLHAPKHPYTRKLLAALPDIGSAGKSARAASPILLEVRDFHCHYPIRKGLFKRVVGAVRAVDGVSLQIQHGKTLALVGESGCGKTTLGKSLLNLLPGITSGQVWLDGVELTALTGEALRRKRADMQIIFQDPFASMNPRMLVGDIIAEGLDALHPTDSETRKAKIAQLLSSVNLPEDAALRYPHEFSGGQRQRICIARALAVNPKLIICDEPTSALDVSVQAQIIQLLKQLQQDQGLSYLFISHDLAVVAELADDIAVMYQGKIVEHGPAEQIINQPQHPYTQKLLAAVPVMAKDEVLVVR